MLQHTVKEVETNISAILAKVTAGETVIVCDHDQPIVEIKPIATPVLKKRPVGLARKRYPDFKLADNFDDPLPDDIMAYFTGEKG